jgi:hypothetical protein
MELLCIQKKYEKETKTCAQLQEMLKEYEKMIKNLVGLCLRK